MIARGGTVVMYPHSELNQTEELKEIHGWTIIVISTHNFSELQQLFKNHHFHDVLTWWPQIYSVKAYSNPGKG